MDAYNTLGAFLKGFFLPAPFVGLSISMKFAFIHGYGRDLAISMPPLSFKT